MSYRRRSYGSDGSIGAILIGFVAVVVLVVIVAIIFDNSTPRSTSGVVTLGNSTAQLPKDNTLILTSSCGKSCTHVWEVTWDGKTVFVDDDGWFGGTHYKGDSCGVDCQFNIGTGWLSAGLDVTERNNDTVDVHWPWGWTYRDYKE